MIQVQGPTGALICLTQQRYMPMKVKTIQTTFESPRHNPCLAFQGKGLKFQGGGCYRSQYVMFSIVKEVSK